MNALALWGGVECTVNRVGDVFHDQMERSGHVARLADLDRFAALGIKALRFPLVWERLASDSRGPVDWSWPDSRLARLRALDIEPIAGLVHHGSGPADISLLDERFPELLARYARAAAERYPWIGAWTPVNEPLTTARFSALYGHWFPHYASDQAFVRALLNQLRGVVLAMREIRAVNPAARLVQTEDAGQTFGTARLAAQVAHEGHRRWLTWDLLTGRVDRTHPLAPFLAAAGATDDDFAFFQQHACPPDVVGLNYYVTSDRWLDHRVGRYPPRLVGGNRELAYVDVEAARARPQGIAGHHAHLLDAWQRYQLPVAITEVHLGCTREEQMRWLLEAWNGALQARADGADVRAVTAWALLGSHDWDSLVTRQQDHYEPGVFDVRAPEPRPTALAPMLSTLAAGRLPAHPVLTGSGWWRRPTRMLFPPSEREPAPQTSAPILVVGARGTLGRAFQRLCAVRGLALHVVSRAELDIAEPARVDAVLRRTQPWAVINAAGYVRVDAAENDREACWRDNVMGPVNLAAACRRRGLPLVTFSSDLVFDGASDPAGEGAPRPYVESDRTAPLNAYGASKAEAETRVLDLLPSALVVRTSAFFGPWDEYNFAADVLRALAAERPFAAADDYIVSPTYVPDLVHAVLDLLIDGEQGIWHLVNDGALTWYAFARLVAERAGAAAELINPCRVVDVWQPAPRPAFTALGSERGQLLRPLTAAIDDYVTHLGHAAAEAARLSS